MPNNIFHFFTSVVVWKDSALSKSFSHCYSLITKSTFWSWTFFLFSLKLTANSWINPKLVVLEKKLITAVWNWIKRLINESKQLFCFSHSSLERDEFNMTLNRTLLIKIAHYGEYNLISITALSPKPEWLASSETVQSIISMDLNLAKYGSSNNVGQARFFSFSQ